MDEIAAEQPCDEDEECGMRRSGAQYSACHWSGSLGAAHLCATTTNLPTCTLHLQHPQTKNRIWLNETETAVWQHDFVRWESRLRTPDTFCIDDGLFFCSVLPNDKIGTKLNKNGVWQQPWRIGSTFVGRSTSPPPPVTSGGCIEDWHIRNGSSHRQHFCFVLLSNHFQ